MKAKNQPVLPHQGRIRKFTSVASLVVALAVGLAAGVDAAAAAGEGAPEPISTTMDIPYFAADATNDYVREQCKLDLYLPKSAAKPFPLLVWFHGGGLQGGDPAGSAMLEFLLSGVLPSP
ncbi:MAG: hypothetical protein PHW08_08980 [Kiritimatiellae bacterium]|nr:hypothetical protein [Kiritimatiellia bacterium]